MDKKQIITTLSVGGVLANQIIGLSSEPIHVQFEQYHEQPESQVNVMVYRAVPAIYSTSPVAAVTLR